MAEVLGYQVDSAWEDKEATGRRVRRLLEAAAPPPGSLPVFAEMFATGFSFDIDGIAEGEQGQTRRFLASVAGEFRCFVLGGVLGRGSGGKGRYEAVAVDPQGRTLARYCKLHPFSFAGEHHRFEPGETLVRFDWNGMVVAPLVCYDLRFPEAFMALIRRGAHLFCVLANWPLAREDHWLALLRARAIENQAHVVGVNRCGCDPQPATGVEGRSLIQPG